MLKMSSSGSNTGVQTLPPLVNCIVSTLVTPATTVCDLGVFIDADLSMRTHVQRTVSRCFSSLRRLRSIRGRVPMSVFQSLVVALVLSRLDYCNSVLVGLPASLIQRLQSVQNAAACSTHLQHQTFRAHYRRTAPPYLSSELTRVADVTTRRRLRSSSTDQLIVPSHRLSTVGARAFPVAGAYIWNGLGRM